MTAPDADPVLARRAKVARLTSFGIRFGMGCYLVATVLFFWAVATGFNAFLTTTMTVLLLVGSAALAPAMVFHYAVKAADRADRDGDW